MTGHDTDDEAAFRARLRAWLAAQDVPMPQPGLDDEQRFERQRRWHAALYRAGFLALSWPPEYGGHGLPAPFDSIVDHEIALAGALEPLPVAHLGRAVLVGGTEEQKQSYLPGMLSSDVVWCQGFSEPDAGSDLASLRTSGVRDGDAYRVSGQKVWTSFAQRSRFGLFLVRTEPDQARHRGISMLVVDMAAPGVTVRPLVQMSGDAEFCEVFLDDVVVPAGDVIGAPGDGWRLAMAILNAERGSGDNAYPAKLRRTLRQLEQVRAEGGARQDPELAVELARARMHLDVLEARALARRRAPGGGPGEGSIDKLLTVETEQMIGQLGMQVVGAPTVLDTGDEWLRDYLWTRCVSIMGGTTQIQRNIVAQSLLGLPRS